MSSERRQILDMLAAGKITAEEAEQLQAALDDSGRRAGEGEETKGPEANKKTRPKYLRVVVQERGEGEKINIRIPLLFLRSGMKLASILPANVCGCVVGTLEKEGVHLDLKKLKGEDLEQLLDQLSEMNLDIDEGGEKVRIFCE